MTLITATTSEEPAAAEDLAFLRELAVGYQYTQVLAVAARFRVVDAVAQGAGSPARIARTIGADEQATAILLGILGHLGIVRHDTDGYRVTGRGLLLHSDHPAGVWALLTASGSERYHAWGALGETLSTGQPAFPAMYGGIRLHDYYAARPDASAVFNQTMAALSAQTVADVLGIHPWARHRVIADIGGGLGITLTAILRATPDLSGILVDLPHVASAAQEAIAKDNLAERCRVFGGDARTAVPSADLYLFRMVLCDFLDRDAVAMLQACHHAREAGAELVIVDRLRAATGAEAPVQTLMSTLNLMVMTGSVERTEEHYAWLLRRAGWELMDVRRTPALAGTLHYLRAEPR